MKKSNKNILIGAIINFVKENITAKNKKLVSENRHSEQEPFDSADLYLKLIFKTDAEIKEIASHII